MVRRIHRDQSVSLYDRKLSDRPSPHFLAKVDDDRKENLEIKDKSTIIYRKYDGNKGGGGKPKNEKITLYEYEFNPITLRWHESEEIELLIREERKEEE